MWNVFFPAMGILLLNSLVFGSTGAKYSYFHTDVGNGQSIHDNITEKFWTNQSTQDDSLYNLTVANNLTGASSALNATKLSVLLCNLTRNISSLFNQQIKSLNSLEDFTQLQQQINSFVHGVRLSKTRNSTKLQFQQLENTLNLTVGYKNSSEGFNAIFKSLNRHVTFLELLKEQNSNPNNSNTNNNNKNNSKNNTTNVDNFWQELQTMCNDLEDYLKAPEFSYNIPSKTTTFKGHFIQLSEAKKWIPEDSETVIFLALNSIIVDDDLQLGGNLGVAMIAPRWIISGNRTFNLDGAEGNSHDERKMTMTKPGRKGTPGNPGGNGGHFLGIGEDFFGEGSIKVSADGGKGGPGQEGGNGAAGKSSEQIDIQRIGATSRVGWFGREEVTLLSPYKEEARGGCENPLGGKCFSFDVSSRDGITAGKNGGDGGVGGYGGAAGSITIIKFSEDPSLQQSTSKGLLHYKDHGAPKNGDKGESGSGGQGGAGGKKADTLTVDVDFCECKSLGRTETASCLVLNGFSGGFENECWDQCAVLTGSFSKFVTGYKYVDKLNRVKPNGTMASGFEGELKKEGFCSLEEEHDKLIGGVKWTQSTEAAANGAKGVDGKNTEDQQQPSSLLPLDTAQPLILFKHLFLKYLLKNKERGQKGFFLFSTTTTSFLKNMEADESVRDLYDVVSLMQEFKDLEVLQATNSLRATQWLSFYQPLLHRVLAMSPSRSQTEEKKALVYLYTAVLSRINTLLLMTKPSDGDDNDGALGGHLLDFHQSQSLVIDLPGFLNEAIAELDALENMEKSVKQDQVVRASTNSYEKTIRDNAMEAYNLVQDIVKPELQLLFTQIGQEVDNLLNEILDLRRATGIENEELSRKQQKLQERMQLRKVFSVLKGTAGVVGFLGPYGAGMGGVVGSISATTESLVLDNPTVTRKPVQLPPSVTGAIHLINKEFTDQKNRQCADLAKQMEAIQQELGNVKELKMSQEKVTEIREKIRAESEKTFPVGDLTAVLKSKETLESYKAEMKSALADNAQALRSQKDVIGRNAEQRQAVLTKITHVQQMVSISADLYSKYHLDQAKLDQLSEQLQASQVKVQATEAAETRLTEKLMPMIKNLQLDLGGIQRGLTNQSIVSLDVSRWRVQSTLRDLRLSLKREFTMGTGVEDVMHRALERLEETMELLISVYGRLQTFSEQSKLARFIATLNKPTYSVTVENFENEQLRTAVLSLELIVKYNRLLQCSAKAFNAFKMWTFPFAHDHLELDPVPLPLSTEIQTSQTLDKFKNLVDEARRRLNIMKNIASADKTTVNNRRDRVVKTDVFTREARSPFYTWPSSDFSETIQQLLEGREILLMAHVQKSPPNLDSIKFKSVHIQLRITKLKSQGSSPTFTSNKDNDTNNNSLNSSEIEEAQTKLNEILDDNFELVLTHMGNSHYQIDGQYYLIPSAPLTMDMTFHKNQQGLPRGTNLVYQKIIRGDIILSPYALWKIKMVRLGNRPHRKSISGSGSDSGSRDLAEAQVQVLDGPSSTEMMPELKDFMVDLDLVGEGSYIRKGAIKDLNVGHFYQQVNLDLEHGSKTARSCE